MVKLQIVAIGLENQEVHEVVILVYDTLNRTNKIKENTWHLEKTVQSSDKHSSDKHSSDKHSSDKHSSDKHIDIN